MSWRWLFALPLPLPFRKWETPLRRPSLPDVFERLVALRERPPGRPVMLQNWHELTFVHWAVDPSVIQAKLPPRLVADTFEDSAYLTFVPFTMTGVRALWQPDIRRLTCFHEWNLRTYVVDKDGLPGVWFFSLDASNPMAVVTARSWYKLPYHYGRMTLGLDASRRTYTCDRRWPGPGTKPNRVVAEVLTDPVPAEPRTLDFWLIERYLLYSWARGRLYSGQVHHEPYPVCQARLLDFDVDLIRAEGFGGVGEPLELVHFSPGVSVEVFPLRRCV